jgi:simple sugar transport system ATP-binding protein
VARDVSVVRQGGVRVLDAANITVRSGEIVGVAGVEGNGQQALLRVLAGRLQPTRGEVLRPGVVGFVPEDRHRDAVVLDFTLVENFALAGAAARGGRMHWSEFERHASLVLADYQIGAPGVSVPMRSLSGGNQQRFVIGRELHSSPSAIVVENPTRGLDVNATRRVHDSLRQAAAQGAAVVVYSSDIDELLGLADRAVVCFGGRIREVALNADSIGRAMVGVAEGSD